MQRNERTGIPIKPWPVLLDHYNPSNIYARLQYAANVETLKEADRFTNSLFNIMHIMCIK